MEIKEFILKRRQDLNVTIALMGVIPLLTFFYILAVKLASFEIFVGETGFVAFLSVVIFLLGTIVGKKLVSSLIAELLEKNRLSAVTETVLTLGHEINNPLLNISGNLVLLEGELEEKADSATIKKRLQAINDNCDRIRRATSKLSSLSSLASEKIYGNIEMIDLNKSK